MALPNPAAAANLLHLWPAEGGLAGGAAAHSPSASFGRLVRAVEPRRVQEFIRAAAAAHGGPLRAPYQDLQMLATGLGWAVGGANHTIS